MFDTARRPSLGAMAALGFLNLSTPAAVAGHGAKHVARAIYRIVEKACPEHGNGVPYNLAAIAEEHFSPGLREALRRAYERHSIGFDILIDAQDCATDDVDLDVDRQDRGLAIARAEFRNFGEKRDIELVLMKVGGHWKVEDVFYRHRDWSARRDLEGGK